MLRKIGNYYWTIRYLKPEQVLWRLGKKLGMKCALAGTVSRVQGEARQIGVRELEHDNQFLARFSVKELMEDRVTFLHESETIRWEGEWHVEGRSHLWNFNLHYFEYLHPLAKAFIDTGDKKYLDKTVRMIRGWIAANPAERGGDGWSAYTISLRLTNWLAFLAAVGGEVDDDFRCGMEESMFAQYAHLSTHLEKDILGNHYFENLKTLVLCALYFHDEAFLPTALAEFRRECREQILPDGMHFELSPMYHKIVLEGLLRVAIALREAGMADAPLEAMAKEMLDAAFTMEDGLSRTPLFNDSGDNVAKSLEALFSAAKHLGLLPEWKPALPDSGYYFLKKGKWKLIVDAGAAGPDYIPGHAHCDAMSFELFRDGQPVLVNCGTYAYQCAERHYFRSAQAHNTVQAAGVEQSEIWSTFRLARRSETRVLAVSDNEISMEMLDYRGNRIRRDIRLEEDCLRINDRAEGLNIQSHLHGLREFDFTCTAPVIRSAAMYAPEYGRMQTIYQVTAEGQGKIDWTIPLA